MPGPLVSTSVSCAINFYVITICSVLFKIFNLCYIQHNLAVKANAVAKLTYLQMLGYDVSWAGFNIIGTV
jgi:hypothetical protein